MASPSSGSTSHLQQNSSSDQEEMQLLMNERKRKRMQSNRESAKRSRMRKQKHLDDLMAQVTQLSKENNDLMTRMDLTTQHYLSMESENSVMRAQMAELSSRLESLEEIITVLNGSTSNDGGFGSEEICPHFDDFSGAAAATAGADCFMTNPWSSLYLNQPIMTSAEMFQY